VELHGGSVFAKSPGVGEGATFSIAIPVAAVTEQSFPRGEAEGPSQYRTVPALNGITVLIVDDDGDSRAIVTRTLEKAGATVSTADSADAALKLIDRNCPHVLVSDIGMPGKNGFALLEELRARPSHKGGKIPAAALTAYTRVEDRVKALCAGFQILLPKPVEAAELIATVATLAKQG
jgi:CheY-like chemotaxis protein